LPIQNREIPIIADIAVEKDKVKISGNEYNEYLVEEIVRAIDFGFHIDDTLLLKKENFVLEFVDIKSHTRRKNLNDVRARVIGTDGKAKKNIEQLTGAVIVIKENRIGVIVDDIHLDATIQALESLIQGSKHGNIFAYLEKQGKIIRNSLDDEDLGLKEKAKKIR
jgi:ribosomal RNA assembly protein